MRAETGATARASTASRARSTSPTPDRALEPRSPEPDGPDPDAGGPGAPPTGRTVPAGSAGRYSIVASAERAVRDRPGGRGGPNRAPVAASRCEGRGQDADCEVQQARGLVQLHRRACAGSVKAATTGRHRINGKLKKLDSDEVGQVLGRGERHRHGVDQPDQGREGLWSRRRRRSGVTITVTPASGAKFTKKLTLKRRSASRIGAAVAV